MFYYNISYYNNRNYNNLMLYIIYFIRVLTFKIHQEMNQGKR